MLDNTYANEGNNKMKTTTNKISLIPLIAIFAILLGLVGCEEDTHTAWTEVECSIRNADTIRTPYVYNEDGTFEFTNIISYRAYLDEEAMPSNLVEVCRDGLCYYEHPTRNEEGDLFVDCGEVQEDATCSFDENSNVSCTDVATTLVTVAEVRISK